VKNAPAKPLIARLFLPLLRNKGHEKSGVPVLPGGSEKRRLCGAIFSCSTNHACPLSEKP